MIDQSLGPLTGIERGGGASFGCVTLQLLVRCDHLLRLRVSPKILTTEPCRWILLSKMPVEAMPLSPARLEGEYAGRSLDI